MPARLNGADVVYHGYRAHGVEPVVVIESAAGERIGRLRHVVRHSPSGMNWGYRGSGPCDTARSLLLDALGGDAACPACRGSGRVVYVADGETYRPEPHDPARHPWSREGWECTCSGGYKDVPYMLFTDAVAEWGDEWVMSRSAILAWLSRNGARR